MKNVFPLLCFLLLGVGAEAQYYQNRAVRFGPGAYYASESDVYFDYTGAFTVEAWVKPDSIALDMMIIGKNFQSGYAFGLRQLSPTAACLRLIINGSFVNSVDSVRINRWTHVAASYDGASGVNFYINGQPSATFGGPVTGPIGQNNDDFYIGADRISGTPAFFFRGEIDELRIWDGVLPGNRIQTQRFIPLGIDQPDPAGYYPLTEAFRMNSSSGGAPLLSDCWPHHKMIPHGVGIMDHSNETSAYIDYNNHIYFDGNSSLKILSNASSNRLIPGKSLTVEAWIRIDTLAPSPAPYMGIFTQSGGTNEVPWGLYVDRTEGKLFFVKNGTDPVQGGKTRDGQWHHVAATCDNDLGMILLYVDGEQVAYQSFNTATGSIPQSDLPWTVGSFEATDYSALKFSGGIDEVRLWRNTVRTPAQIRKYLYVGLDDQINDPRIDSLVVFNFDGTTRQSNKAVIDGLPPLYAGFVNAPRFVSPKSGIGTSGTSPLLRHDGYAYPQEFTMKRAQKKIRDFSPVSDTLAVSGITGGAASLEVALLLNHSSVSDLDIYLHSPAGDSLQLTASDLTGCYEDGIMTLFIPEAALPYNASCNAPSSAPFSPAVRPAGDPVAVMAGNPNGNWRLRISDRANGDVGFIHAWGLHITGGTSITEPETAMFKSYVYPNPNDGIGTVYFELPQSQTVLLEIFDQTGRRLRQQPISDAPAGKNYVELDLRSLPAGVYHYRLTAPGYRADGKMLIGK